MNLEKSGFNVLIQMHVCFLVWRILSFWLVEIYASRIDVWLLTHALVFAAAEPKSKCDSCLEKGDQLLFVQSFVNILFWWLVFLKNWRMSVDLYWLALDYSPLAPALFPTNLVALSD